MCTLYLPVQWVYEVLDCVLFVPHRVEHNKSAALHTKYEQNPIKTAYAHIHAVELTFIRNIKEVQVYQDLPKGVGYHYI